MPFRSQVKKKQKVTDRMVFKPCSVGVLRQESTGEPPNSFSGGLGGKKEIAGMVERAQTQRRESGVLVFAIIGLQQITELFGTSVFIP